MKHIILFEKFNLSEAGTGYNSWKMYGNINDLADTLNKKLIFERNIRATFSGFTGMEDSRPDRSSGIRSDAAGGKPDAVATGHSAERFTIHDDYVG